MSVSKVLPVKTTYGSLEMNYLGTSDTDRDR